MIDLLSLPSVDMLQLVKGLMTDCRNQLALDALCLLCVSHNGLQECELVDLLGGAQYNLTEHTNPVLKRTFSGLPYQNTPMMQSLQVCNTQRYQLRAVTCRSPQMCVFPQHVFYKHETALLDSDPRGARLGGGGLRASFNSLKWSAARRWLLAAFVSRSRGLWFIDHSLVRSLVEAQLLKDNANRIAWMQRLAAYFWTLVNDWRAACTLSALQLTHSHALPLLRQPAGRRKAEELPWVLAHLHAAAAKREKEHEALQPTETGRSRLGMGCVVPLSL